MLPDLDKLQNDVDAITMADYSPMANGEQIESYNPPSYYEEAMAVINLISDTITSANIDELVEVEPLKVQLLMMELRNQASLIVSMIERKAS